MRIECLPSIRAALARSSSTYFRAMSAMVNNVLEQFIDSSLYGRVLGARLFFNGSRMVHGRIIEAMISVEMVGANPVSPFLRPLHCIGDLARLSKLRRSRGRRL